MKMKTAKNAPYPVEVIKAKAAVIINE